VARIEAISEPDPFWNWICLPHYDAGSRCQNEARGFSRAVIVVGKIHRSERLGRIGDASGVAPPYVGIRNDMTSLRSPIPDASDTSFRAVYSKKDQVSLKPSRSGFSDQLQPPAAGKGYFDSKAQPPPEIVGCPFQNFPSRGDGGRIWIQRIQAAGDGIGVQQPSAALEIHKSRERRLPGPVRAGDYRKGGHTALGGVHCQFTNDSIVFSGRRARKPSNFESPAIGALHHVGAAGVHVEDRKSGGKRLGERLAPRSLHGTVELSTSEIVGDSHG